MSKSSIVFNISSSVNTYIAPCFCSVFLVFLYVVSYKQQIDSIQDHILISFYTQWFCKATTIHVLSIKLSGVEYFLVLYFRVYQLVLLMFSISLFISFALQLYVPIRIIWPKIQHHLVSKKKKEFGEYALRIILVMFTGKSHSGNMLVILKSKYDNFTLFILISISYCEKYDSIFC